MIPACSTARRRENSFLSSSFEGLCVRPACVYSGRVEVLLTTRVPCLACKRAPSHLSVPLSVCLPVLVSPCVSLRFFVSLSLSLCVIGCSRLSRSCRCWFCYCCRDCFHVVFFFCVLCSADAVPYVVPRVALCAVPCRAALFP